MPNVRTMVAVLCSISISAAAQDYYVSGSGLDTNSGTTTAAPFRTLAKAAGLVNPGDTVWAMNGIYSNPDQWSDGVVLSRSGTAAAWISWKAYPGHAPEMRFNAWNGFKVAASFQVIDGFTVTGCADAVTLAQAQADALNASASGVFNGSGITVDGRSLSAKYHHLTVRNCVVRKCTGGGIGAIQSDYITIENCRVTDNCWYGRYAQSGISLWQCWNSDLVTGYHNHIQRNVLGNNHTSIKWVATGALSDGNGIIFDDSKNTQNGSTLGAYSGRTLISDNLSVGNGGSGIHSYMSEHVDIIGNTAYQNGQVVGYPEIFAGDTNDARIVGNIMFARSGAAATSNYNNTNVTYDWNLYFNGTSAVTGASDVSADPLFVSPGLDVAVADFRVQAGSPAIDSGTLISGVTSATDLVGVSRPQGAAVDRGAYERPLTGNSAPTIAAIAPQATTVNSALSVALTVGDVETAVASLVVTATSSDSALVASSGLVVGGSGTARTLTVTPATDASGSATITATVTDAGGLSSSAAFVLTVSAANGVPTIVALADRSVLAGQSTGAIAVTIGDAETPASALSVTASSANAVLVPASGLVLGGSGADRTLTVTPAAGKAGSTVILVTVSDGSASASRSFTLTVAALPPGWSSQDIGSVTPAGSAIGNGDTFTVAGAGADIANQADAFRFVWQPISGDFDQVVAVDSQTNTNMYAKAGLMARESTAAGARHVSCLVTPRKGTLLVSRAITGGTTSQVSAARVAVPTWLKLSRRGSMFTASQSANGTSWTVIGSRTVALPATVLGGLAVTSRANGTLSTAAFSHQTLTLVGVN